MIARMDRQMPHSAGKLTVGDVETLGFHGVSVHRDWAAAIAALAGAGFVVPGRRDLPPLPFRLPFDWHADPLSDRNWMFNLQAWRMLDPYLNRLLASPSIRGPSPTSSTWSPTGTAATSGAGPGASPGTTCRRACGR